MKIALALVLALVVGVRLPFIQLSVHGICLVLYPSSSTVPSRCYRMSTLCLGGAAYQAEGSPPSLPSCRRLAPAAAGQRVTISWAALLAFPWQRWRKAECRAGLPGLGGAPSHGPQLDIWGSCDSRTYT